MTGYVKTETEIQIMTEGGRRLGEILKKLLDEVKVGVVPLQIDTLAQKLIKETGGKPSFMTVNKYQYATCISVNDGVVHGIPTKDPFKAGDIVSIDVGLLYQGFHTDTSWTKLVVNRQSFQPEVDQPLAEVVRDTEHFLKVGEEALEKAIELAKQGNRVGHISQAIQTTVESAGYSVVKSLVGHGVGRQLHESPQIPGIVTKPIEKTPLLEVGMVIAIEVIYNMGRPDIIYKNDDGWSLATTDGSLSGLFEQTIAITDKGPIILTQRYI